MGKFDASDWLLLIHLHELRVEWALIVTVVGTFFDYVVCVGTLGHQRTTLLYLPIYKFDLFFDLFEKFLEASLFKDRLSPLQVFLGLLRLGRVADHIQCANHFVSFGHVD